MFNRKHHQLIALALQGLNAPKLAEHQCYFGGGTAIALQYGEYRESVDLDFMVSNTDHYRQLRQLCKVGGSVQDLFLPAASQWVQFGELRSDQYGIRTRLLVMGTPIKFEIVLEGRIQLDAPGPDEHILGVATLRKTDLIASKLLANSDRWADPSVNTRDLIDLAMMHPTHAEFELGLQKARRAYGDSILSDLNKAIHAVQQQPERLLKACERMAIQIPPAQLMQHILALNSLQ